MCAGFYLFVTHNIISYVQWIAKLCVDSIDNDVRYHRESIKQFWIKSLYFKYDYRWLLHTILQGSVHVNIYSE